MGIKDNLDVNAGKPFNDQHAKEHKQGPSHDMDAPTKRPGQMPQKEKAPTQPKVEDKK